MCEFQSLLRKQAKFLSFEESALAKFFPFEATQFGTWDFVQNDTLEAPAVYKSESSNLFVVLQRNRDDNKLLHTKQMFKTLRSKYSYELLPFFGRHNVSSLFSGDSF